MLLTFSLYFFNSSSHLALFYEGWNCLLFNFSICITLSRLGIYSSPSLFSTSGCMDLRTALPSTETLTSYRPKFIVYVWCATLDDIRKVNQDWPETWPVYSHTRQPKLLTLAQSRSTRTHLSRFDFVRGNAERYPRPPIQLQTTSSYHC